MNRKKIAIITGASAGLGVEYARQIEERFHLDEIWLIARRAEPMRNVANEFRKAKGIILSMDITNEKEVEDLEKRIAAENPDIRILVNNAGLGKIGPFHEMGKKEQLQMIRLNVLALTEFSHIAIPYMSSGASIIQVASSIAFCPAPYFSVYAATKSYVLSFSRALNFELKPKGINVLTVCPGPVATEFLQVAQNNDFTKTHGNPTASFNQSLVARAADVVKKSLDDLVAQKDISIYGLSIKAFAALMTIVPEKLAMKVMANYQTAKLLK
jgi:short-subunit dehydrogenase